MASNNKIKAKQKKHRDKSPAYWLKASVDNNGNVVMTNKANGKSVSIALKGGK